MYHFGTSSLRRVEECHPKLQLVLQEAIKHYDFSCIWGYRDRETQNTMYENGASQLRYPDSWHNRQPSRAFDVIPYPFGFAAKDIAFYWQATHILRAAAKVEVDLNWGGHWKMRDLAHFELAYKEV